MAGASAMLRLQPGGGGGMLQVILLGVAAGGSGSATSSATTAVFALAASRLRDLAFALAPAAPPLPLRSPSSMRRASSSTSRGSSQTLPAIAKLAGLSSIRQMTHSDGEVPADSVSLLSVLLARRTIFKASVGSHQRMRTNFCPCCFGSSMTSVAKCWVHPPTSTLMNSRCSVFELTRTGPMAIASGGCFEASPGKESNSNSNNSLPTHRRQASSSSFSKMPSGKDSGSASRKVRRELVRRTRLFSRCRKVMI
mmetsp:Transcript_61381/g.176679  ORF Transcript_61381/g.176679 Transcript_61381/m.176679 type:complete len:253 (+) Transcript_61381:958-1716(+)